MSGLFAIAQPGAASRPSSGPIFFSGAAWSHDGTRIAVFGATRSSWELYVGNADGSRLRRLAFAGLAYRPYTGFAGPSWSPNDRKLAYATYGGQFAVIGVDGKGTRVLAKGGGPAWSPGGRKIAFHFGATEDGDASRIYVINPSGSGRELVAADPEEGHFQSPTWSPDGKQLAFARASNPELGVDAQGLGVISSYRGPVTYLLDDAINLPKWSPKEDAITFDVGDATCCVRTIAVLDLESGGATRLRVGQNPSWSADGKRIAFDRNGAIWVMNRDGSSLRRLIASS